MGADLVMNRGDAAINYLDIFGIDDLAIDQITEEELTRLQRAAAVRANGGP